MSDDADLDTRSRILAAALRLVAQGGDEAATTRAVAAAAGVQAPTIYRLFGDKGGLLEAVAELAFKTFVAAKAARPSNDDPVEDLRRNWDSYIDFGVANPSIFLLMHSRPGPPSGTIEAGLDVLRACIRRVAAIGRLRVSEERAVDLVHAMGTGTILTLIGKSPDQRCGLSEAAREATLLSLLDETSVDPPSSAVIAASTLRALLSDVADLSPGERHLLDELLQRIACA